MRIALLAHGLRAAGGKSVGLNILKSLGRVRPQHTYFTVVPDQDDFLGISLPGHSETVPYTEKGPFHRIRFDVFELPSRVRDFRPDVIWGLGNMGLVRPPCNQAILLHKPQMVYPSRHRPSEAMSRRSVNRLIRIQLKRSLRYTQLVFCQTDVMRRRFRAVFDFHGRVELMPNAISRIVMDQANETVPHELANISRHVKLFCLTRYYAHKNLELIVDCFDRFRKELDDIACILTIGPEQHPRAGRLMEKVHKKGLEDAIVNVGPLPQDRLGAFYLNTDGLLLPTLLESFSGTYLEAMAFGRPIITSDLDFAREVCGRAALYFDPWAPDSLMQAIIRLKTESGLADQLVTEGEKQRTGFQSEWDHIVDEAMKAVENCINK